MGVGNQRVIARYLHTKQPKQPYLSSYNVKLDKKRSHSHSGCVVLYFSPFQSLRSLWADVDIDRIHKLKVTNRQINSLKSLDDDINFYRSLSER